jgi:dolichyl-phosphate-mannose--protein O-mannosyl transferase
MTFNPAPPLFDEQALSRAGSYLKATYFDETITSPHRNEHMQHGRTLETPTPPLESSSSHRHTAVRGLTPFGRRFMGTLFGALFCPSSIMFLKKPFCGGMCCLRQLLFALTSCNMSRPHATIEHLRSVFHPAVNILNVPLL